MRIIGGFDKHSLQRIIVESSEIHLDFVHVCPCYPQRRLPVGPDHENPVSIPLKPFLPVGLSHGLRAVMWTCVEADIRVRWFFLRIHFQLLFLPFLLRGPLFFKDVLIHISKAHSIHKVTAIMAGEMKGGRYEWHRSDVC